MGKMVRILLTSVYKPFGSLRKYGRVNSQHALHDFYEGQSTFAQSIFSLHGTYYNYGLDLIALNIKQPTTVLDYPSLREFIKELKKYNYEYVGISCVCSTYDKALVMRDVIRKYSPGSKIIIGGYGSLVPEAEKDFDLVAHGDGIYFFNKLLGQDIPEKLIVPEYTQTLKCMGFTISKSSVFVQCLGCSYGCEFCSTSYAFNCSIKNLIKTPKEMFDILCDIREKIKISNITICNENFLINKKFVDELGDYMIKDGGFSLHIFASVNTLYSYDPLFLVKMGIKSIWIGNEGIYAVFNKRKWFDIKKIVEILESYGVIVMLSSIIGLEEHTPEKLEEELNFHISCKPVISQFLIYTPTPGTPLWNRLDREGKLIHSDYKYADGFSLIFKHEHLSKEFTEKFVLLAFKREYNELGPTIYRTIKTFFNGYNTLKDSEDALLRKRSEKMKDIVMRGIVFFPAFVLFAPSKKVRAEIRETEKCIYSVLGKPTIKQRALSVVLLLYSIVAKIFPTQKIFWPKLVKRVHNE